MLSGITGKFEFLNEPEVLKLGETIELKEGVPLLLGRAETQIDGHSTRKIEGLEDNLNISGFGLKIDFDGQKYIFSRPDFPVGDRHYRATNKITITNTSDRKIEVKDRHDAGIGCDTYRIYVGDEPVQNGYLLEVVGNNKIRLVATINNGDSHVVENIYEK